MGLFNLFKKPKGHKFTDHDLIISSPHDLMAASTEKRISNGKEIDAQKNTVWTPFGRETINEAYLKAGIELRTRQKEEREADPEWVAHDNATRGAEFISVNMHKNFWHLDPGEAKSAIKSFHSKYEDVKNVNPTYYCKDCLPKCSGHKKLMGDK